MTSNGQGDEPLSTDSVPAPIITEDGPYVLRSLLDEVPLSGDGSEDDIKINCVDYLGESLPQAISLCLYSC
jgi:vacuolar protein sorting-associated protein 3